MPLLNETLETPEFDAFMPIANDLLFLFYLTRLIHLLADAEHLYLHFLLVIRLLFGRRVVFQRVYGLRSWLGLFALVLVLLRLSGTVHTSIFWGQLLRVLRDRPKLLVQVDILPDVSCYDALLGDELLHFARAELVDYTLKRDVLLRLATDLVLIHLLEQLAVVVTHGFELPLGFSLTDVFVARRLSPAVVF